MRPSDRYHGGMLTMSRTPPLPGRKLSSSARRLRDFLDASPALARVEIREAKGSTPREVATWMLVSPDAIYGTIGGGQLEFMAIDKARQLLRGLEEAGDAGATPHPPAGTFSPQAGRRGKHEGCGQPSSPRSRGEDAGRQVRGGTNASEAGITLDIPLGPEIGQCCGGRVKIDIALVDGVLREAIPTRIECEEAMQPHVYLFGGGHVGQALAAALALLPLAVTVVESRADALDGMPDGVATLLTPVPEQAVRDAPAGSAYMVLTHDHALDFLIVAEALGRGDAAYVGMIGSKTKRATCRNWYLREAGGSEEAFARLVCPIGGSDVKDKRPAVIAALAAAEVLRALTLAAPAGAA